MDFFAPVFLYVDVFYRLLKNRDVWLFVVLFNIYNGEASFSFVGQNDFLQKQLTFLFF